ncbi:D-2-hydroxyacid dehydrogenase [Paenibacillus sp. WQ 127069]|uniref:D-2-hydroxyacid dehydrogenase n=1 Tax=Paenibacillus baimaensis TaxID=2982185 RepID=A0ABT2UQ88_9BACL|nr:D-2-hydroxyacid dehydrogenase [Paenibacillus sp. WQ 127069]MCU6796206.1 D-2-hydroxyacid dehydrogenase [Paenibacillus sp. WQ 127069]
MANIVVLDGYTLNPGDLDWGRLEQLGNVTVYYRSAVTEIVERAAHADIVLTNKTQLSAAILEQLPKLKYIGVLATGYNIVDTEAAKQRGIPVTNIPTYGTQSVAQFVFALLLELCHRVQTHSDAVHAGDWNNCPDFCFTRSPLIELSGKTMGLIGLGRIGGQVARIANAFGMRVIAVGSGRSNPTPVEGVEWVELDQLLAESDVISLHCPLTPATEKLINAERLALMKHSAILINTSRGALINEQDLAIALNDRRIAGAAVDVLSVEPPVPSNPLYAAANCLITPHIAWATKEARARLMGTAVDNVQSFLSGHTVHVVNG